VLAFEGKFMHGKKNREKKKHFFATFAIAD
jgi:hypothetical protein